MDDGVSNSCSDNGSELASADEDMLDIDLPVATNKCFPSDEYILLVQHVTNLRASSHGLWHLSECLQATSNILASRRMRQADLDTVRRFFRDDLFLSVDKLLCYPQNTRLVHNDQDELLLRTLQLLVYMAASALKFRANMDPADAAHAMDLDGDLVPVAQCLLQLFNQHKQLHQMVIEDELPPMNKFFGDLTDNMPPDQWAARIFHPADDLDEDEEPDEPEEPVVEQHKWVVHLINLFGGFGGFDSIMQLLHQPGNVSFPLLNMMTAVLAQATDCASVEAHEKFNQIVGPVLDHVAHLVEADSDRLSDFGNDRTYNSFQCLVNTNLPRIMAHGPDPPHMFMELQRIQCTFVLKMLESSSFNKLLSGVRECNRMLRHASQRAEKPQPMCGPNVLKSLVDWMEELDIVQRILRTNLHQRQYMAEVQGIMVVLTLHRCLTPEHLDLLWAVTEKEDTYEAVKTHVFDLLAEIASRFVPAQRDMLFAKLERRQERSKQDTLRLLGLLQRLAHSDSEATMCDKIIGLVWDLTTPPSTHPELLVQGGLLHVVKAYKANLEECAYHELIQELLQRCFHALVKGEGGQVPLLRSMRELLKLLPESVDNKETQILSQDKAVDGLNHKHLMPKLVHAVCSKIAAAREAIKAAQQEATAAGGAGLSAGAGAAAAAVTEAALAALGEGSWSYIDIVAQYLMTLRVFANASSTYFDTELAEQLWDTLMVAPPNKEDQLPSTQSFFKGGFQSIGANCAFFEAPTQQTLLEKHMVRQDASKVSWAAAKLFVDIFTQVNLDSKSIVLAAKQNARFLQADKLQEIKGLDFIWQMYMRNPDERVASLTKMQLLNLYHCNNNSLYSAPFRRALVERVVSALHQVAPALAGADELSSLAPLVVSRCLGLALSAVKIKEVPTMPPVPAHCLAWRGTPLVLDIQRDGASRLRLTSHSNEYVGLLRERLARHIGCSAKHVRMFWLGKELQNDATTLPVWDSKNRAVLTAMASPEPNRFSQSPAEYRQHYEETAFPWMLSQAEGLYALLLSFIDAPAGVSGELSNMALDLLATLPTYPALTQRLATALDGSDKQQQLAAALDASSSSMLLEDVEGAAAATGKNGSKQQQQGTPYQTLYALQALCALLFPTFDGDALPPPADAEVMAEASVCPSPAGQGQSPAAATMPAAAAPGAAAATAAAAALQQQQHREQWQQEFLQSRGLEVVLEAAHKAGVTSKGDLKLRRQLSELLVMLLHNLVDAAHAWSHQGAVEVMSGAESGAVAAAGPGGAAASSQHGGAAAAASGGDSGVAAMTGLHLQQQGEAGGSTACANNNDVQQQDSTTAAGPQQQQQQQPASPSMEDAMSSPQPSSSQQQPKQPPKQQQQAGKGQRQRGGDLPPLPPAGQANSNGTAAGAAQNLAAVFGSHTLKLMADTLLGVAVDTSQMWGSSRACGNSDSSSGSSSNGGSSSPEPGSDDSDKDVVMVKDALQLLLRLLEQQPSLVQQLLLEVEQSPLISVVLVNPHYPALRRQAAELLERLVAAEVHPRLLPWLLLQLASARPVAQVLTGSCAEFYELLSSMIGRMGRTSWSSVPQQLFSMANQMLDDEVANLQAAAVLPAPATAPAAAVACTLLQGRLQLVLALVRALDRRAVGSSEQGGLIRMLLQDFLFPEAVQQLSATAGALDLSAAAAAIEPRCATPSCRKAALELLSELMGDTPASLEEGVNLLIELHYVHQQLGSFNTNPRLIRPPGQYMGLKNGGATCYMNAVFQQLFMQPAIRAGVLGAAEVERSEQSESVFAQLQAMFAVMELGKGTFVLPRDFWYAFKDYDGSPIDVKEHQDAYEFFTRLQDFVDQHLISTGQRPAIKPVMGGTFVQQIICTGHDFTSEREEEFYQVSVEVKGMGSLEKSLDDYVKGELMEGDNAYLCEELGKKVSAVKRMAIKQLPQMLCFHLKRFEFDYHNQTRYKVRDRFEFPLEIDMFKYTADGLAAADQQQKAAEQQQQQTESQQGGGSSSGGAGGGSSSGGAGGGSSTCDGLRRQLSDAVQQALAAKAGGASNGGYIYDLMGVVVHSGSAFTGHYYSFIKERKPAAAGAAAAARSAGGDSAAAGPPEGQWYIFDDKNVKPWNVGELEFECFGGKASQDMDSRGSKAQRNEYERAHSAYMLFYERRQQPAGAAAGAAASSSGQQQQQEAAEATQPEQPQQAAEAGDVPMAAAPALPAGAVETANPSQAFVPPYNMPVSLYKHVIQHNIYLMWCQHVLDKDYFRFVRQLVDSRGDLGQLSTRKSRKRDGTVAPGGAGGAAGTASGSSGGRIHSSMSCDVPGATAAAANGAARVPAQIMVGSGEAADVAAGGGTGTTPTPMAVSPAPTAPISAAAAAAAAAGGSQPPSDVAAAPLSPPAAAAGSSTPAVQGFSQLAVNPPAIIAEPQQSPGPSSRRGEEAEAVAQALLRLGVLFQFQVYLRASDSLRSESNVWTEALTSLMGSGPSSSSCLQLFLELHVNHPEWMQQYLMESDSEVVVPTGPKTWVVDMLGWALETAAKRCSRALCEHFAYKAHLVQVLGSLNNGSGVVTAENTTAYLEAVDQHRDQLPPLADAVLHFVEMCVETVHECLPMRQGSGGGASFVPDLPQLPADVARVLLRYAQSGPWAVAYLMQADNFVQDLVEIITVYMTSTDADDGLVSEDVTPLYELLSELLQHASNLPQLAAEMEGNPHVPWLTNPFIKVAGCGNGSAGASSGSGTAAQQASSDPSPLGPVVLSHVTYKAICQPALLKGLTCICCASSFAVVTLASLLTFNNAKTADCVIRSAQLAFSRAMHAGSGELQGSSGNVKLWEQLKRNWSLMVLVPDAYVRDRVFYWLTGMYPRQCRAPIEAVFPVQMGAAYWIKPLEWPAITFFKFVSGLLADLHEMPAGPLGDAYRQVCHLVLLRMAEMQQHVHSAAVSLYNCCSNATDQALKDIHVLLKGLLEDMAAAVAREQQQRQASQQQQVNVAAAAAAAAAAVAAAGGAAGTQSQ